MTRTWRALFALEIGICLATVVYWIAAPWDFLTGVYRAPAGSASHYLLLQQGGIVVFCAYVYLYARMLFAKPFDLRSFRWLQESMAIGDVAILALAPYLYRALAPDTALFAAQAGMAALWLAIRTAFLVRTRAQRPV